MKEKVDVLVATYNGEKYLREQLDSIIKQTYKNIRILISDDCSKDRTQEILQEYEKKDDRIKIFLHDRNLGSNKNFEFLLRQVESKFYMLSDQDDVWLPEKIEKTIQKQKETGADLVFGDLEVVNEKIEEFEHLRYNIQVKAMQGNNDSELQEQNKLLQEKYAELIQDEKIKEYFEAEMQFNVMLTDVNKIIAEEVRDVL